MAHDGEATRPARNAPENTPLEDTVLSGVNAPYIERLYDAWLNDPQSVGSDWRTFFEREGGAVAGGAPARKPSWARTDWPPVQNGELTSALDGDWGSAEAEISKKIAARAPAASAQEVRQATKDSLRALMLIRAYRIRGHLIADLDPLGLQAQEVHPELDPASLGFTDEDMDRPIFIDMVLGLETATLREILAILKRTYCGTFAVEFMHITDPDQKAWLQQRIEGPDKDISFTPEGKRAIFRKLVEAEGFENFLNAKYTGTKRFGLDGAEAMVPALEQIIKRGGALGVKEIVVGMPHRGRLNVLAAVMGKPYHHIFHEFHGGSVTPDDVGGSGDVKYHLGASSDREFDGNKVHLSLTANPSHLEAVNPVVLGKARSKQDRIEPPDLDAPRTHVLPLLLHGDAASPGKASSPSVSDFPACAGIALAGPSISSSTIRLASQRARNLRGPRPIHPMLQRWSKRRSFIAMAMTRNRWFMQRRSPLSSGKSSAPMLSSICSAIAALVTMKATNRASPSRGCIKRSVH